MAPKHFGSSGTSYFIGIFFFMAFMASTVAFTDWLQHMFSWHPFIHHLFPWHLFSCQHISFCLWFFAPVASWERMRAIRIWRRPDNSTVIGLGPLGNWILRSTTHSALQSTILGFLYFEDSSNPCLQAFGQTCAGFYIVTLRFRIVDTPSIASERDLDFHMEHSD